MPAAHLQGPPRSTVADLIAGIVYHYAATASRGAWASGTAYSVGDTVASGGWPYVCFAAGTSTGSTPAGMGSQRDANGVGWTPQVYVGERYLKQHGTPVGAPRLVIVPGDGSAGDAAPGVRRVGDGNLAGYAADFVAYLWAAETTDDITRYAAIEDAVDRYANILRKLAPGRHTLRTVNPTLDTNVVTFGEDRQFIATYQRSVPRDAAIWAVPLDAQPTLDAMRPNGDLGTTYTVNPTTNGSH